MCICRQIASIADKSKKRVKRQLSSRVSPILNELVFIDGGHEFASSATGREERLVLLAELLGPEESRLYQKLRDIRSFDVTVAGDKLPAKQVLRCYRKGELLVAGASEKREVIQIRHGLRHHRIRSIFHERHIA